MQSATACQLPPDDAELVERLGRALAPVRLEEVALRRLLVGAEAERLVLLHLGEEEWDERRDAEEGEAQAHF